MEIEQSMYIYHTEKLWHHSSPCHMLHCSKISLYKGKAAWQNFGFDTWATSMQWYTPRKAMHWICCAKWTADSKCCTPKLTVGKSAASPAYHINISEVIISSLLQLLTLDFCQKKAAASKMIHQYIRQGFGESEQAFLFSEISLLSGSKWHKCSVNI